MKLSRVIICTVILTLILPSRAALQLFRLRVTRHCPGCNLTYTDLSYMNLQGANLRNANLTGANLSFVNLNDADLSGAILTNAQMHDVTMKNTNLCGATLLDSVKSTMGCWEADRGSQSGVVYPP